jgi:hypothetical protein
MYNPFNKGIIRKKENLQNPGGGKDVSNLTFKKLSKFLGGFKIKISK